MIRSLYVRVTMTFLVIVVISMGIAYWMADQIFTRDLSGQFPNQLDRSIVRMEQLYAASSPKSLSIFIKQVAEMQNIAIVAIGRGGEVIEAGKTSAEITHLLTPEVIENVFAGQLQMLPSQAEGETSGPSSPPALGRKAVLGERDWAIFVRPDRVPEIRSFQRNTYTILITLLVVGCILIPIAARYLVKPLKMMTEATKRIATGDFSVQLPVHRRDELGNLADSINRMTLGLSQLETMRQDFVSNVSHEIQSPLTSIGGFAEVLRSEQLTDEERNRYVGIIKQESSRLSRLSENLLKLASLDSKQHPFEPRAIRLDRQLRDVVLSCEPQWMAKRLTVELLMEETVIVADEDQLSQVWNNLLANSMKFTPDNGHIRITLSEESGCATVRIADNGSGISPADQERVFERFYKADAARDRVKGGSGLGLSIVKKIVDIHEGLIEIESSILAGRGNGAPSGTTIRVMLPLRSAQLQAAPAGSGEKDMG
ncbi:HAMP domain-containing sensor histidine kinase [Paenibacillus sp. FSL H8-0537]|uniref:HAMP domain-containing sensor histidine kinase n=1 Tax=Paenibacillus sp. FSL H8-0537 TaxID=2921399 RepID=UPI0031010D4D